MSDFSFGVNNLNFTDIQQELKDYFESLGYKYVAGGNYDLLIKTLSYITMLNSQHISNTINNLFISSANTTEAIYQLASQIGYVPRRRIPSKVTITAIYTPVAYTSNTFTVSELTFTGKNNTYTYIAKDIIFTLNTKYNYYTATFVAEEKTLASYDYYGTNEISQEILLPTTNIAKDVFDVKGTIGSSEYDWDLVNSFESTPDENSRIYFVDVNNKNEVRLLFGNSIVGQVPQSTEKITVEYYTTNGEDANGETDYETVNAISSSLIEFSNKSNYTFTFSTSFGGSDYETNEEIQRIAPKYFSSIGNHIVEKDFDDLIEYAEDYVAYADLENINTINEGLGKNYLSLVPLTFRTESLTKEDDNYPNGSFPISELQSLTIDTITYSDINTYYNGWVTLKLASPTYLWVNIQPHIEIKSNKVFTSVESKVFTELLDYVKEEYYETNIFGFDKQFRNSKLIKIMNDNSNVVSSKIDVSVSIPINKNNIIDKYFIQIPENFLQNNFEHFNNLVLHNNYTSSELLIEDRTIYCSGLEDSSYGVGNDFKRYLVSDDLSYQNSISEMFDLTFDSNNSLIGSNIKNIYINNKLISINIFPYENDGNPEEYFVNGIPLLYTQDNIQEVDTSSNLYNYSRDEKTYFVYLKYSGTSYLLGEIIMLTNPDNYYLFKEVDNRYGIRKLFTLLNISQYSSSNIIEYVFNKSIVSNNDQYNIKGYISLSQNLQQNDINLKLVSRKEIGKINLLTTPVVTITDTDIFDYDIDTVDNLINFYTVDDTTKATPVVTYEYDESSIYEYSTNDYSNEASLLLYEYKDNRFSFNQSNTIFTIYCYEKYDDCKLADIDIADGSIEFNKSLSYYPDYLTNDFVSITLTSLLDEILTDSTTIYEMSLVSQNQIGDLENINENFDTNGIMFILPNLNHCLEI